SGVQLHPTSLASGTLGDDAYRFVDWLERAGQSWWQMLPLGPPDRARSPYKSASAFAAWPGLLGDRSAHVGDDEIDAFRARESFWIDDWERLGGGPDAVADQVRFAREWAALRAYASERGIGLIGDVPIYVAPGGADHFAHPELFLGGEVSGAPPDNYSELGQLWGNPLYDWPALQRSRYRWWIERLRRTLSLFDVTRIDHFRGFVAYWAVPEGATDARGGRWRRGPGRAVFDAARAELGTLPVIAEDLGVITPAVTRLRRELGLPGMVVMQFGFDPDDPHGPHRLEHHKPDSVVYTGTHDNDTLRGWFQTLPAHVRDAAAAQIAGAGVAEAEPWWSLIRLTFGSPARLAMVQAQDVLGLGSEARMNVPGQATGSWRWQMAPGALTGELADRLRAATEESGRLPSA
ncbi:MAG: 4-alpha-glucanotransferase, partial [Solirubrobacteraceae bacterium]|nr:4-alpha-glucanotransferase [Solirubrobacteraceae bacterium]